MSDIIKIGILGWKCWKGVELAVAQNPDMKLIAVFTRRSPETVKTVSDNVKVVNVNEIEKYKDDVDVLILCGGSATDLPEQAPKFARLFNCGPFDTHAKSQVL